ncbi:hypothetical protein VP01_588g9 [Puccinia sorghi]|uniref:Uncharacterized protein n=1 Tax=Puccinia sorghi TaxID=27349 RepID=A0A0L6UHY6_9BASI|nr:hypothetical protein VP01_588g9 [Puccinia sorghi]
MFVGKKLVPQSTRTSTTTSKKGGFTSTTKVNDKGEIKVLVFFHPPTIPSFSSTDLQNQQIKYSLSPYLRKIWKETNIFSVAFYKNQESQMLKDFNNIFPSSFKAYLNTCLGKITNLSLRKAQNYYKVDIKTIKQTITPQACKKSHTIRTGRPGTHKI